MYDGISLSVGAPTSAGWFPPLTSKVTSNVVVCSVWTVAANEILTAHSVFWSFELSPNLCESC